MSRILIIDKKITPENKLAAEKFFGSNGHTVKFIDVDDFIEPEDLRGEDDNYDYNIDRLLNEDKFEKECEDLEFVIIKYLGDEDDFYYGLKFSYHIRLSKNKKLRACPIFFLGQEEKKDLFFRLKYFDSLILLTKGTRYSQGEKDILDNLKALKEECRLYLSTDSAFKSNFLNKVVVNENDSESGRHGIANQWGAYRMAKAAGLEIDYEYPKTLYFKYLTAQTSIIKPIEKKFPTVNRILLIDDEYEKGWEKCLEGIFGNDKIGAFKTWEEAQKDKIENVLDKIENAEYDLIFLDLYKDGKTVGKEVLKEVKGKDKDNLGLNPIIPVIMFTASNKAWNMDELYQAGADGYYVKEHPETASDPDFSIKNFENFHKTVEECLNKGELLKKYWLKIQKIKKSKFITDKLNQENKGRIEERLMMFLGLLKRAYQQTSFDKETFFYSEWELAFLTLWSTFNEIQECHFEKVKSTFNIFYNDRSRNYDALQLPTKKGAEDAKYLKKWVIKGQSDDIYFENKKISLEINERGGFKKDSANGTYKHKFSTECYLNYDSWRKPYYSISNQKTKTTQPEQRLSFQIAFLMLMKRGISFSKNNVNTYLENLKDLNDFRNKLYLTHGEDDASSNFDGLYQHSRPKEGDLKTNIEKLFEIVYLLCVGKECKW